MEFWNSILTEKSWNILLEINKKPIKFILIGGWANYLWTKTQKSKDIDIVLEDFESLSYLKQNYNLSKNDNLKKYELKIEEIDIDIYVGHYSHLGLPIEELKKHTTIIENIRVAKPEALLILKQAAEICRKDSIKGLKDRIDIVTLLQKTKIDFGSYRILLAKFKLDIYKIRLKAILKNFNDFKYIDMSQREYQLLKKQILRELN